MRLETFAPLSQIDFITHAFTLRTNETKTEDFEALLLRQLGFTGYASAEQTHSNGVAVVSHTGRVAGVDALVTRQRGLPLVIRCADCAPVFIVDKTTPASAVTPTCVERKIIFPTPQLLVNYCWMKCRVGGSDATDFARPPGQT